MLVTPSSPLSYCVVRVAAVSADPFRNIKKLAVKGGAVVDPDSGKYQSLSSEIRKVVYFELYLFRTE